MFWKRLANEVKTFFFFLSIQSANKETTLEKAGVEKDRQRGFRAKEKLRPNKHFTILEPHYRWIDKFDLVQ